MRRGRSASYHRPSDVVHRNARSHLPGTQTGEGRGRLGRVRVAGFTPGSARSTSRVIQPTQLNAPFGFGAASSRGVAIGERVGPNPVDVVSSRWARLNRGLNLIDRVNVNDWLLAVLADAEHGLCALKKKRRGRSKPQQ